jgi:methyl-galactoside transport system ATP-binding protein
MVSGLHVIDLSLREGEILGIAGLDGAGRSEILKSIFGLIRIDSGEFTLKGRRIKNRTVREAIENGFALVSEERRADGIFPILSILENTVISSLKRFNTGPILSSKRMKLATRESIKRLGVKAPSDATKIGTLSGGNQQKVIIGRWLLTEPTVMMLDEPTRGIDVGAKYEIYKLIIELATGGKGIIMVSSEMAELLGICDRIIVISGGRVAGEVTRDEATQEKIMALAAKFA